MDKDTLHKKQEEVLKKFREFQKTKDVGLMDDIQGIVEQVGQTFVLTSDEGHKILFRPKKLKELLRSKKEQRTKGGIILPK